MRKCFLALWEVWVMSERERKNGGVAEDFGMNVYRKSFKLEMWLRREKAHVKTCVAWQVSEWERKIIFFVCRSQKKKFLAWWWKICHDLFVSNNSLSQIPEKNNPKMSVYTFHKIMYTKKVIIVTSNKMPGK